MNKKKIIIFKNDATGDLIHSREAIYNIINSNKDKEIILFLSKSSKEFSFLFQEKNLSTRFIKNKLGFAEKIKIFLLFFDKYIYKTFILTPKTFYFFLPFIFKKIKFYGLCIEDVDDYKRPNFFLKKYLYKFVINKRNAIFKRQSIFDLQNLLIAKDYNQNYKIEFNHNFKDKYINDIKDYFHFHINQKKFDKLGWKISDVQILLNELQKYKKKIIITRDIEKNLRNMEYYKKYNIYDFNNSKLINNMSDITLMENVAGKDLYKIIKNAYKVIAFHGMITSFAWMEKKNVMDLYFCEINNWNDYRKYRNSFYEFKPSYKGYDFIIPSNDIYKTIRKMNFFLKK